MILVKIILLLTGGLICAGGVLYDDSGSFIIGLCMLIAGSSLLKEYE